MRASRGQEEVPLASDAIILGRRTFADVKPSGGLPAGCGEEVEAIGCNRYGNCAEVASEYLVCALARAGLGHDLVRARKGIRGQRAMGGSSSAVDALGNGGFDDGLQKE